jgi:hypothetical protein
MSGMGRVSKKLVRCMAFLALGCLAVVVGVRYEQSYYSCHLCRNLRTVSQYRLYGIALSSTDAVDLRHPVPQGHEHQWWLYSRSYEGGFGLCWFDVGSASNACQYQDGKTDVQE